MAFTAPAESEPAAGGSAESTMISRSSAAES
jgi:hypothetical protein